MYAQLSSRAIVLMFGMSLHVLSYLMYTCSEGFGKTVRMHMLD